MDALRTSFSGFQQFRLTPTGYMLAWNGVLVLGFEGFPEAIESVKKKIKNEFPCIKENPGAKWPKVTLAALSDGQRLKETDMRTLEKIFTNALKTTKMLELIVNTVSAVKFNCRNLEKIACQQDFPLILPVSKDCSTTQQKALVQQIISETESPDYFSLTSGTGREIYYYREDCSEWTLVTFLNGALKDDISIVQKEIEKQLPGLYEWMEESSRHVTILNLNHVQL